MCVQCSVCACTCTRASASIDWSGSSETQLGVSGRRQLRQSQWQCTGYRTAPNSSRHTSRGQSLFTSYLDCSITTVGLTLSRSYVIDRTRELGWRLLLMKQRRYTTWSLPSSNGSSWATFVHVSASQCGECLHKRFVMYIEKKKRTCVHIQVQTYETWKLGER